MSLTRTENSKHGVVSKRRRGATAVEFAVSLPLVLLLFFGAIEFSRVNMLRHTIAQAAYEGARSGVVPGATADEVRAASAAILSTATATSYTIDVIPATIEPETPEVTVSISLPLNQNSWAVSAYSTFFSGRTLAKSFTLRRELNETVTVP